MNPLDHLHSLYATAPEVCAALQQTTHSLRNNYKAELEDDSDHAPSAAGEYMAGFDDWQHYTRTTVCYMHSISANLEQPLENHLRLLESLIDTQYRRKFSHLFRQLGLLSLDASSHEIDATIRSVDVVTIRNLADIYSQLEVVRPLPELTARQIAQRQNVWQAIVAHFARPPVPIRSAYA